MKIRYEEMLPHEIIERRRLFPAAFIGLGGLEWHGEHLAVGNDALKAEKLCELAAKKSGGFAFPTLWYGEPRSIGLLEANLDYYGLAKSKMGFNEKKFTHEYLNKTAEEQIDFYRHVIYHVLIQMNTLEMKAVCLVCGHYPLSGFIKQTVEKFNSTFKETQVFAGTEFDYCLNNPDVGGDHAAKWETSYLMYLRPDCVDLSVYNGYCEKPLGNDQPLPGVFGIDPREHASIEIGEKGCNLIVEGMVKKAKELISLVG